MYLYMKHLISQLNRAQQQAATAQLGKILVLAGAGSGKTRVLVHRIAWLINEMCVRPSSIFVVTFTNIPQQRVTTRMLVYQPLNSPEVFAARSITISPFAQKPFCPTGYRRSPWRWPLPFELVS